MKRLLTILVALSLLAAVAAPAVGAVEVEVGNWVRITPGIGGDGSWPGGAFTVTVYEDENGQDELTSFVTFCADLSQQFQWTKLYQIDDIGSTNSTSMALGPLGQWLYWAFLNATPDDLSSDPAFGVTGYMTATAEYARAMQIALWYEMGYVDTTPISGWSAYGYGTIGDSVIKLGSDYIQGLYNTNPDDLGVWNSLYADLDEDWLNVFLDRGQVKVMVLAGAQDQLVFAPSTSDTGAPPTPPVPEPASVAIWSLIGLTFACGLRMARRRRAAAGRPRWSDQSRQAIHEMIDRGRRA